jgi:DNA-binding response OmpR family regulator
MSDMSTTDHDKSHTSKQLALVMIVEDEIPIAEALALIVEDAGYAVILATSAHTALDHLDAGARPMLIITDLMMPRMDGADFIHAVRALLGHEAPPIILTTAGDHAIAALAQADALLYKPFSIRKVESLLHRYLASESAESPESPE